MSGSINNAFNIARTGLQSQEALLAIKTQNISAQGVDAYKRQYAVMYDLAYSDYAGVGVNTSQSTVNPTGVQIGTGVQMAAVYRVFSQGEALQTGRSLDTMIDGDGFYAVTLPEGGTAYTRVGSFERNASNQLVMPKTGFLLEPAITIPSDATSISISPVGEVYVETTPGTHVSAGTLQLTTFFNPSGLRAMGDNMFVETQASGTGTTNNPGSAGFGYIKQAYREGSNVNAVEEMTDLIKIEKVYEMLTKAIRTGDAMMASTNSMVRT